MKVLALDLGSVRVGVAIGDTSLGLAYARDFLPRETNLIEQIKNLCQEEKVELIIVGLPRNLDGTDSPQTSSTRVWADELQLVLQLPVQLSDERWTSREAAANLQANEKSSRKHKQYIDSESARICLQSWLDNQR